MPILEGTDGVRKMSKSYGNYIGISEPVKDMFGKVMSLPDDLIIKYFELTTDAFPHKIDEYRVALQKGANPRDIKLDLAQTIVRIYHGSDAARDASREFEKVFTNKETPRDLPEYKCPAGSVNVVDLLIQSGLMASRSEAKRKLREGAIDIDGEAVKDVEFTVKLTKPIVIKAGKHRFLKVLPR
jgi:tyrosyl-tRNA synthetase